MRNTAFGVGNLVRLGNGKVVHRVVAVTTTGRIPTYDLVAVTGARKGARRQAVTAVHLRRAA